MGNVRAIAVLTAAALGVVAVGAFALDAPGPAGAAGPSTTIAAPPVERAPSSRARTTATAPSGPVRLRITAGASALSGTLDDTPTARALAAQLPLTVEMRDHGGAEKTGALPRALPTAGAPGGHDPRAGDLGYYAPGGDLVLYYDDAAPSFDGIVRIGRFSGDLEALRRAPDLRVRVERRRDGR